MTKSHQILQVDDFHQIMNLWLKKLKLIILFRKNKRFSIKS